MKLILLFLTLIAPASAQLVMSAQAPAPVTVGGGVAVGQRGGSTLYYWIVARYPAGTVQPITPAIAFNTVGSPNLSVSNYVTVSWAPAAGATGYDVLRSDSPMYPATVSCTCAVVLNTSSTTVDDTGSSLSAYPSVGLVAAASVAGYFQINNRDESTPFVNLQLVGLRINELTRVALISGTPAENDCMKYSLGRLVSAGAACGSGSGGYGTIQSNGVSQTQRATLNLVSGSGVNVSCADATTKTDCTAAADSAVVATHDQIQAGKPTYLVEDGSTGDDTYTGCPADHVVTGYTAGQSFWFIPATGSTGPATLNVCGLGPIDLLNYAGSDPDVTAGAPIAPLYNGTNFRLQKTGAGGITALTGDVTASGTGSVPATLASIPLSVNQSAARALAADFTQFIVREDFCGVNNAGGGLWFGKYSWTVFSSGTSSLSAIRDANDPCIVNLQTGATSTNLARLQQAGVTSDATSGTPRINPTADTNFDFHFVVQLGSTITNVDFAVGFCQVSGGYSDCLQQATSTQPGLWFKYSTADSDTNFEFVSCNTGGCTASVTDLGVAPAASTTYRFRVRSTVAGTYLVSINGGSETSVTPASVANSNMEPFFLVKTETSAARTLQVREMALIWTGRTN